MGLIYKEGGKTFIRHTEEELSKLPSETDWARVDAMTDANLTGNALSDPNTVDPDAEFDPAEAMTIEELLEKRRRQAVSLRVKQSTLLYFKRFGKGYQTKMNALLDWYAEGGDLILQRRAAGGASKAKAAPAKTPGAGVPTASAANLEKKRSKEGHAK